MAGFRRDGHIYSWSKQLAKRYTSGEQEALASYVAMFEVHIHKTFLIPKDCCYEMISCVDIFILFYNN